MRNFLTTLLKLALKYVEVHRDDILKAAIDLVKDQETNSSASGESKRHQVYAALIKLFPDVPKTTLSMAIEQAMSYR